MAIKIKGLVFKQFYSDPKFWIAPKSNYDKEYTWHDDAVLTCNGSDDFDPDKVADTDDIYMDGGCVFGPVVGAKEPTLDAYFRRWQKAQTSTVMMVTVPNDRMKEFKAFMSSIKGTIHK